MVSGKVCAGGGTGVLLGVVAAEVDLLLCVPDVRLPAPGAPAQDRHIESCPACKVKKLKRKPA